MQIFENFHGFVREQYFIPSLEKVGPKFFGGFNRKILHKLLVSGHFMIKARSSWQEIYISLCNIFWIIFFSRNRLITHFAFHKSRSYDICHHAYSNLMPFHILLIRRKTFRSEFSRELILERSFLFTPQFSYSFLCSLKRYHPSSINKIFPPDPTRNDDYHGRLKFM